MRSASAAEPGREQRLTTESLTSVRPTLAQLFPDEPSTSAAAVKEIAQAAPDSTEQTQLTPPATEDDNDSDSSGDSGSSDDADDGDSSDSSDDMDDEGADGDKPPADLRCDECSRKLGSVAEYRSHKQLHRRFEQDPNPKKVGMWCVVCGEL